MKLNFEWDENKENINILKHRGITFYEAATCFEDQNRLEAIDEKHSINEVRFNTIAESINNRILFVVFTFRRKSVVRIISARKANKKEVEYYEKENS